MVYHKRLSIMTASILAFRLLAPAQEIWFTDPVPGDTLYVGDTISITYEMDQAYRDNAVGPLLSLSVNGGKDWHQLCPVEAPVTGGQPYCTIVLHFDYSGQPHVVIPDTLFLDSAGTQIPITPVTDEGVLRLQDYANPELVGFLDGYIYIRRSRPDPSPQNGEDGDDGGCGSGAGLALIPGIFLNLLPRRRGRKIAR
ncbi:MAG: hypothetical protein GF344_01385 [Chitinivibrionales bacterium]|nr:hypothetical protein [Chitinivibrionales bacterium]